MSFSYETVQPQVTKPKATELAKALNKMRYDVLKFEKDIDVLAVELIEIKEVLKRIAKKTNMVVKEIEEDIQNE